MTYKNNSYYKVCRTKLLNTIYPKEADNIGAVTFREGLLNGIKAKLWHDRIEIVLGKEFIESNIQVLDRLKKQLLLVNEYGDVYFETNKVIIEPKGKFDFSDTLLGMKQRAAYFVMIMQLALQEVKTAII